MGKTKDWDDLNNKLTDEDHKEVLDIYIDHLIDDQDGAREELEYALEDKSKENSCYLESNSKALLDSLVTNYKSMDNIFWIDALYEKHAITLRKGKYISTDANGAEFCVFWHGSDIPNAQLKLDIAVLSNYNGK